MACAAATGPRGYRCWWSALSSWGFPFDSYWCSSQYGRLPINGRCGTPTASAGGTPDRRRTAGLGGGGYRPRRTGCFSCFCSCRSRTVTLPGQEPLRVVDRDRPDRRLLRRQRAPPALPWREPSDQPGAAHHGHRAAAVPHRGPGLLRQDQSPREDVERVDATAETTPVRHRLRTMGQRRAHHMVTGPGGQPGSDSDSSAAGSQPHTSSSDKPLPGPAGTHPRTPLPAAS